MCSLALEAEPRAKARDPRREHLVDGSKLRPRLPGDGRGDPRVEQIEQIDVECDAPSAHSKILRGAQVRRGNRVALLRTVWLESKGHGAELTEGSPAVGIGRSEDVRPLPRDASLGL